MKREKAWNLIGVAIGVIIIITGILFCATPADSFSTTSVDTASFGGDFYTYEYKATRAAANNAAVAANNLRELSKKTANYVGCGFIFAGLLVTLEYAKKICLASRKEAPNMQENDAVISDVQTENTAEEEETSAAQKDTTTICDI